MGWGGEVVHTATGKECLVPAPVLTCVSLGPADAQGGVLLVGARSVQTFLWRKHPENVSNPRLLLLIGLQSPSCGSCTLQSCVGAAGALAVS